MRRASADRDNRPSGAPSSVTRPRCGCRVPASSRSSVVLPAPLGPRIPTKPLDGIVSVTPRRTAWEPYANQTSAACSNSNTGHRAARQRGKAEDLLVCAIEEILDAGEDVDAVADRPRAAGIPDGVSRGVEQPAKRAKRRLDVEDSAAAAASQPEHRWSAGRSDVERPLMARAAKQRVARREWRWCLGPPIDREDLAAQERVG